MIICSLKQHSSYSFDQLIYPRKLWHVALLVYIEGCTITHSVGGRIWTCYTGHFRRMIDMDASNFDDIKTLTICAVIVVNITLNSLVIAVIARYRQLREDRTTLFVFSLTLSDLATGCTAMPISAALCSSATPNVRDTINYLPKIHAVFAIGFGVNSLHSLCWVTVCKMMAVTKPLRYKQLLTRNRCYFIICGIWLTGALMAATVTPFVATWNLDCCTFQITISTDLVGPLIFAVVIAIVCPAVALVYSTTRIFFAILRTHREITVQVSSIGRQSDTLATIPSSTFKSIRSGRKVLIMCLAFLMLTFPFAIFCFMLAFHVDNYLPWWYKFVSTWIFSCNSSVNSLIYVCLFQSVRDKTAQMLRAGVYKLCTIR